MTSTEGGCKCKLELEIEIQRKRREESSSHILSIIVKGSMHYLIMASREYAQPRGNGYVILGGGLK